ncbi:hypothetical protein OPU71_17460 [Niveibacterium sp. 24ML]|uniref:type III-B CRISPR module-associated Cmr3 family protein n=1 Tax=Niveibacterium sp. 24ML TaxID=2985512 RepID=UPI00226EB9A9|nr:type III-B CRISPR module-associated Cmr3 family protein [Niveibacterium sp. 24ML]MCX9157915.1 hypothetical protein [Niveibacterium sp. 24ML]
MTSQTCFIEPLDVLFLRGNKLFGDPGSYGESLVPPWPSVAAGALRSRILADDGIDFVAFAQGKLEHPALGTPAAPGSFTLTAFQLARRHLDGRIEMLIAPPADLIIAESPTAQPLVRRLQPTVLPGGLEVSSSTSWLPVLAEPERSKPGNGYWLTESGWIKYLAGQTPTAADLVRSSDLWAIDHRVGVGLDPEQGSAADGRLFSTQAVSMAKRETHCFDVGFLASVRGAQLPAGGLLRFGGDGRGAALHGADKAQPKADLAALARARRCRIVLTSPGLFPQGWQPPGIDAEGNFTLGGISAKLVCAAIPRAETVSGWDIAQRQPKAAQRTAPTGSVYWLDQLDASADALGKLAENGLWNDPCQDASRRAEGFNRFAFAAF